MRRSRTRLVVCALAGLLIGCGGGDGTPKVEVFDPYQANMPPDPYESWYPEETGPPEGTRYAIALIPLGDVSSLPGMDQRYINHVMAQLVTIARANLRLLKLMGTKEHDDALGTYHEFMGEALENIEAEDVPRGLRNFHDDLVTALTLQRKHFEQAAEIVAEAMAPTLEQESVTEVAAKAARDAALKKTAGILEGKAASAKLTTAWSYLSARYDGHWSKECKESIFTHFRVVDL